jgi:hypothetical protein
MAILKEGQNCWRIASAERVAYLIEGRQSGEFNLKSFLKSL